ncbi:hypothetical protein C0J52_02933 [Blattella germanica]|nr:hypothetical protein C0J52_02933 [Blattella germanica]
MEGGMKAVVWTDFLQGMVMLLASVTVIILGVSHVGGFSTIWQRNWEGGRIRIFDIKLYVSIHCRMSPSPLERMSFWSVIFCNIPFWLYLSTNQAMIQKYMSVPTLSKARRSLYIYIFGIILVYCISCFTGLLIYAEYQGCDPVQSKKISKPDELLTYYVTRIATSAPGLSGLFVSGICSAALSTLSSTLNSLGATVFEDFIRPFLKRAISDQMANNIIKLVVFVIGVTCILMAFVVEKMGLILQLCLSITGVTGGATVGLFSFGMFYPRGNAKGALAGGIVSLILMGWIVFGTQKVMAEGKYNHPTLPITAEECGFNSTEQMFEKSTGSEEDDVFVLYKISFLYYNLIGMVTVFVVGILVSHLTEPPQPNQMDPMLFTPIVRKFMKRKDARYKVCNTTENTTCKSYQGFTRYEKNISLTCLTFDLTQWELRRSDTCRLQIAAQLCLDSIIGGSGLHHVAFHHIHMISGIMILGLPSEIYMHGTLFWLACVSAIIVCLINSYLYLPVFYDLQLTSVYEGGMKAVVWTDFLQGFVMVVSSIAIVILGLINVGGFTAVWQKSMEGGRIRIFEMDPSPLVRLSFWSMLFGNTMLFLNGCKPVNGPEIFITSNIFECKEVTVLLHRRNGHNVFYLLLHRSHTLCRISQLRSYDIKVHNYYSITESMFICSTMSSYLNSFGAIVFEDFIRPRLKTEMSDRTANNCMKLVILIIGALSIALVMNSLVGISGGAITAIFSFGILYPRGNAKNENNSVHDTITSEKERVLKGWKRTHPLFILIIGSLSSDRQKESGDPTDEVFILYRISFIYYSLIGFVIVFIVGIPVSVFTDPPDLENMNPAVFSPFLRKYVNKKTRKFRDNNQGDMELLNLQT